MKRFTHLIFFMAVIMFVASGTLANASEVTFSGFVDAAYYNNSNSEESTFSLDQAEFDIEKVIEEAGGLRIDIQHVRGDDGTTDNFLEQGYVWVDLPAGAKLTFGKFNAPIGFELLDPNDMYQYSHAMVFDNGLPTNLTGAMLSAAFGMVDVAVYAVNGWDQIADDNKDKTFGARIGVTPMEGVNIGLSFITGAEGSDADGADTSNLSVFDLDLSVTMIENLTIGAEYNSGTYENMSVTNPGDDATWSGFLVMANYAFSDKIALTLRYDSFTDNEGARLDGGVEETRNAITISPSYAIADGFGVLAEYRLTSSDEKVFADKDGKAKDTLSELALEFTYNF